MNHTPMQQLEIFTIRNPCRGVCESNRKGYCKGCLRRREERLNWQHMTDCEKRHILHLCALRWQKLQLLVWQEDTTKKSGSIDDGKQIKQLSLDF